MSAAQIAREFKRLQRLQKDLRLYEIRHGNVCAITWLRRHVVIQMKRLARLMRYGAALLILCGPVLGQDVQHRHHPPQDMPLHDKFYSTWFMPDQPTKSCCSKADCYWTEVKFDGSDVYAKRREDGKWLRVPKWKIEQNYRTPRESPDGRNHLCAPPPTAIHYPPDTVFCFTLGSGI